MSIQNKLYNPNKIIGTVEEKVIDGQLKIPKVVRGDIVYEGKVGMIHRQIGYVKDGIAYRCTLNGPPQIIGIVKYNQK